VPAGLQIQSACILRAGRFDSYTPPPQELMANECFLPVDVKLASRAGWLLKNKGIPVRVVPSPPEVDPECGFSLVFPCERAEEAERLLDEAEIAHKSRVSMGG
jgi:hypothetical protein